MSYTPTVWQDGDHVTAAKLNKLEQGVDSMSYTPTVWTAGDVVTAEKLNKLEQGVADSGGGGGDFTTCTVAMTNNYSGDDFEVYVTYLYGDMMYPSADSADMDGVDLEIVLYKGEALLRLPNDLDPPVTITATGSIEVSRTNAYITGDGTITFS